VTGGSLERFHAAQERGGTYEQALAELRAGAKRRHWLWFVFPQLAGLGRSETSRFYAISSLQEAREYLADPVLGSRLRESAAALLAHSAATAEQILGGVDALKLRSSMTLFSRADSAERLFSEVLERYFDGQADAATDELLGGQA
jgi:uncharacterized protein (DUF1810 family)